MTFELDRTGRRILGAMVEKEFTTPDRYPLTVSALQAACNQRSNRDPEMTLTDFEIEGALNQLFLGGWVTNVRDQGRLLKWKHRLREKLHIANRELAVLAELLLRGPQAPGELRSRVQRMHPLSGIEDVVDALTALEQAKPPLAVRLPRRAGERADRHGQTLACDAAYAPASAPAGVAPPPPAPPAPDWEQRLQTLEDRLEEVEARLRDLERGRSV